MKTIEITSEGTNYSAIDLGNFDQLMDYSYIHPKLKVELKGKIFTGEVLKTTGAEISFQIVPPHGYITFLHQHREHEEIYVFLKGSGQFQVDGTIFDVSEGSIVRVAPNGKRAYRNNSENPLVYMCIQVQSGSLKEHMIGDGFRLEGPVSWDK